MEGFDDLLAPSRSILEENPFEDPFAKPRSGSPDPWSSFGGQQHRHSLSSQSDIDYFKSGFEDHPSTTQATESHFTSDHGHSEQSSVVAPADPLDAATVTAEDHEAEPSASHSDAHPNTAASRTPGFGLFTSSVEEQPQTVVDPGSDSPLHGEAPPISPGDEADTAITSLLRVEENTPSQLSSPQEPASSTTSPERAIVSPLDQQSPPNIDRAFASLALGGESHGGWQTGWGGHDHAVIAPIHSTPIATAGSDDDDDDTPIGQTARFRNAGSPQVSTPCCRVELSDLSWMHSCLDLLLRLSVAKGQSRLFLLSRWRTHKRSGLLSELTPFILYTLGYVLTCWSICPPHAVLWFMSDLFPPLFQSNVLRSPSIL